MFGRFRRKSDEQNVPPPEDTERSDSAPPEPEVTAQATEVTAMSVQETYPDEESDVMEASQTLEMHDAIPLSDLPLLLSNPSVLDAEYSRSIDHVWNELARIDLLIRAQLVRWRALLGEDKPSEEWGMINVNDAEVRRMLHAPVVAPDALSDTIDRQIGASVQTYVHAAHKELTAIADRIRETERELRLQTLAERCGLSRLECDILLVCLWAELDDRYRRLYGYLMDDTSRLLPTVNLILDILTPTLVDGHTGRVRLGRAREAFAPGAPLLRQHLIALSQGGYGAAPTGMLSMQIDPRIVDYLLEGDVLDARLDDIVSIAPGVAVQDPWTLVHQDPPTLKILRAVTEWSAARYQNHQGSTLLLAGKYGSGRIQAAHALCFSADSEPLLRVDVAAALRSQIPWNEVVARVYREAGLRWRVAIFWIGCEAIMDDSARWHALTQAAEAYDGITFLESTRGWTPNNLFHENAFAQVNFPVPSYELRVQLWRDQLAQVADFTLPTAEREAMIVTIASSFPFTEGQIADSVIAARGLALQRGSQHAQLQLDDLLEGCRLQASHDLQALAQRIEPRESLTEDDLILPPASQIQFQELITHLRFRDDLRTRIDIGQRFQLGKGTIVLFTGSSGTGKTMAAEILAKALHAAIYRVDLAALVSKYVGETEKNINQIFNLAEGTNAVLFFDEADALFGKRGEVKEAQDRWANLEVNYLLQRVEQYSGVVILTSNLRQNIDEAFLRRIHASIDFPFPDAERRHEIWRRALHLHDSSGQMLRFPDVQYHVLTNPIWRDELAQRLRDSLASEQSSVDTAEIGAQVAEMLLKLTRDDIRRLLDPVIATLNADAFNDLLEQEVHALAVRFRLTGGNIKNIAVEAAVRALHESKVKDCPLRLLLRHIIAATAREYQKLGKPVTRGEFGEPFYDWVLEDVMV